MNEGVINKSNCDNCIHKEICNKKKDFEEIYKMLINIEITSTGLSTFRDELERKRYELTLCCKDFISQKY